MGAAQVRLHEVGVATVSVRCRHVPLRGRRHSLWRPSVHPGYRLTMPLTMPPTPFPPCAFLFPPLKAGWGVGGLRPPWSLRPPFAKQC